MKTNYIKINLDGITKLNLHEKAVLCYIASLSKKTGYCFATNNHLSETLSITDRTLYRILQRLEDNEYIRRETKSIGYDGKQRKIYVNPNYANIAES